LRRWRLSRLIGTGFISACSGLEITNIGVFTYIGSVYGFNLFWSILLSATILAFFQQLAYIVGSELKGLEVIRTRRKLYALFTGGLFLANIATMTANIVGFSVIVSDLLGVNYVYVAILLGIAAYSIVAGAKGIDEIEKVLSILTLFLAAYIYLAVTYIVHYPEVLLELLRGTFYVDPTMLTRASLDVIAVFGAAAAPYALVMEMLPNSKDKVNYTEEFVSIGIGLFFTSLASLSIGFLSAITLHSKGIAATNPRDLVAVLGALGPLAKPLFVLGVFASSLLAVVAIMIVNAYVVYEYRRRKDWPRGLDPVIHSPISREVNLQSLLASLIGVGILLHFIGADVNWFVKSIKLLSVIISLTGWTPLLLIVYFYRYTSLRDNVVEIIAYTLLTIVIGVNITGFILDII